MAASSLTVLDGTGASKSLAAFADASGALSYQTSGDTAVPHYAASKSQLAPVATPTAVFVITGSATKTIRIKSITLNGGATSAGSQLFSIKKNSTAGTLGSAVLTALTAVPLDSASAAGTAAVSTVGTANYTTLPTLVGAIFSGSLQLGALTTGAFAPTTVEFGKGGVQALVLRGVAEVVTVDLLGAALVSGGKLDFNVVWSEDAS